tara:strand:+ start:10074 stop:10841 length:768 start_codon:yes stop_codon:yes gene_type:complete
VHRSLKAFAVVSTALISCTFFTTIASADQTANWQGLYGGLALGGSYSAVKPDSRALESDYFTTNGGNSDSAQLNPLLNQNIENLDVTGAALFGYDFQSGNVVYGFEGDLSLMSFSETETFSGTYNTNAEQFNSELKVESDFSLSLRPKIGYAVDNYLLYASFGPSLSRFKTTHKFSDNAESLTFSDTKTVLGLSSSIGAGYQLDSDWVLRGEYLFSYYPGIVNGSGYLNAGSNADFDYDADFMSHNIRFALIKRF